MTRKPSSETKREDAGSQQAPSAQTSSEPDRRKEADRRGSLVDRRLGLDRRRGPGRRRSADRRAAEDGGMTDEQFEFLMAIERYKKVNSRPFPTWTEVLDVIHAIGYRRVEKPGNIR